MKRALIALIVCAVMVSACAMTSVASAKTNAVWVAGKSDISKIQGSDPQAFERLQTYNPDNDHLVTHDLDKIDKIVVNFNSNNPNGPHPQ